MAVERFSLNLHLIIKLGLVLGQELEEELGYGNVLVLGRRLVSRERKLAS